MNALQTGDGKTICITNYQTVIFSEDLKIERTVPVFDAQFDFIQGIQNFVISEDSFLVSCQVTEKVL